jgi:hypothetical protein
MNKKSIVEKLNLTKNDINRIEKSNISWESIAHQLHYFEHGTAAILLKRACTINDGIVKISGSDIENYIQKFENEKLKKKLFKFVPASGAASRMFKDLLYVSNNHKSTNKKLLEGNSLQPEYKSVLRTLMNLENFGFYDELKKCMLDNNFDPERLIKDGEYTDIIEFMLTPKGLNLSNSPKGIIKFHRYEDGPRTAFEEHIVEAQNYASDSENQSSVHFTLSDDNYLQVEKFIKEILPKYESIGIKVNISYSTQKISTDTIAFYSDGSIARDEHGEILLRPAGHGALLENLNEIDADIIFIKNIDNVLPDRLKNDTFKFKKLLAGILLEVQAKVFYYLRLIEAGDIDESDYWELKEFVEDKLNIPQPENLDDNISNKIKDYLHSKLNRPIRVCGMVMNEGEPGGGPFWVQDGDDNLSLQIVEAAQLKLNSEDQKNIFNSSTHFNPVDIVCAVKNYKGEKFNLLDFRNPDLGIISSKSQNGEQIKVFELPGLWNGGMHNWITLFYEVPLITFNPVKEVNDLLKSAHQ